MWPFKKKKIYRIKWCYAGSEGCPALELVKAYDASDAWKYIKKEHDLFPISLLEIEELGAKHG